MSCNQPHDCLCHPWVEGKTIKTDHNGGYPLFPPLLSYWPIFPLCLFPGKCLELHLRVSYWGKKRITCVFFFCLCCMLHDWKAFLSLSSNILWLSFNNNLKGLSWWTCWITEVIQIYKNCISERSNDFSLRLLMSFWDLFFSPVLLKCLKYVEDNILHINAWINLPV